MGLTHGGQQRHLVDPVTGRQVLPAVSREKLLPFFLPIYEEELRAYDMEPFLEELDARTVLGLEQVLSSCNDLSRYYLTNAIKEAFKVLRNIESYSALNNLAVFAPTAYGSGHGLAIEPIIVYLNGFMRYPRFRYIYDWLENASLEDVTAARTLMSLTAVCRYTQLVEDDRNEGPIPAEEAAVVFIDEYLRDRVIENPLLADEIAAIVRKDHDIDPATVRLMIDFDQKALREGAL